MFYTIKYATSHKDANNIQVNLDKSGNMFVVCAFEKGEYRTVEKAEFSRYDDAEIAFAAMCAKYDMYTVQEPSQDWDATDFD